MDSALLRGTCPKCGRSSKTNGASGRTVQCLYCAGAARGSIVSSFRAGLRRFLGRLGFARSEGAIGRTATRKHRGGEVETDSTHAALPGPGIRRTGTEQAFVRLRENYGEARALVSPVVLNANLEWILGVRNVSRPGASLLSGKMIGLVEVWLQDLAAEVDRALPREGFAGQDSASAQRALQARRSVASSLRAATESFLISSRPSP